MAMLLSWGRYPRLPQRAHALSWRDSLQPTWQAAALSQGTTLAFGNGRSYGDSCLAASGHVVHTRHLDRLIAADWHSGVLRAEAGTTLEEVLAAAIPRGWMLPVTPGTKYVTLGGAVANDVHGKNHHVRGTFGRWVRRFELVRSDATALECSPSEHTELFNATIGGLGLTGVISWVELQLMPIRSSLVDVTSIRFDNVDEFFALSEQWDASHEYSVAWVDCQSKGRALGRGIFMVGDHANHGELAVERQKKYVVPVTSPVPLFNRATLRVFNELYFRRHPAREVRTNVSYDRYFYPLDSILEWNRIYGRAGFQQYQCVVPQESAHDAIKAILGTIAASGAGSFLSVLKRCGDIASPGLLSFPQQGTSLALDFPQRTAVNDRLFERLDAIVRQARGRIYPAKDAHMSGVDFRTAYPRWAEVEALRDPAMLSRFWERITRT